MPTEATMGRLVEYDRLRVVRRRLHDSHTLFLFAAINSFIDRLA